MILASRWKYYEVLMGLRRIFSLVRQPGAPSLPLSIVPLSLLVTRPYFKAFKAFRKCAFSKLKHYNIF